MYRTFTYGESIRPNIKKRNNFKILNQFHKAQQLNINNKGRNVNTNLLATTKTSQMMTNTFNRSISRNLKNEIHEILKPVKGNLLQSKIADTKALKPDIIGNKQFIKFPPKIISSLGRTQSNELYNKMSLGK